METCFHELNHWLQGIVWGPFMLLFMTAIGIFYLFRTGFLPLRKGKEIFRSTFGELSGKRQKRDRSKISPFEATSTALAGTLGTGNIVGIATALTAGGPGAVFWMWVSAFFGMATKYAEIVLAVHFREKKQNGETVGGPMYYIEKGLGQKWLAVLFAVFCALAAFGIGNATQVNSISQSLHSTFGIAPLITGVVAAVLAGFVILGGMKRISSITSALIPMLAAGYIAGAIVAIILHWESVPAAFGMIFEDAFSVTSAGGGLLGYLSMEAVRFGFSRGIFSNEAGLGSAPIAHAAADTDSPARQGMWGIFEVFFDTIVMCTITALVILTSGSFDSGLDGADLTAFAFSKSFGGFSDVFLSVSIALFAFATLVGWFYYGEKSVEYLTKSEKVRFLYRCIYIVVIVFSSVMELQTVWDISDTLNGLMAVPNLIALLGLSGIVTQETQKLWSEKQKKKRS